MPRDVSGNYSLPAGTAAVSSTTANSAHVNSRFSDLETDANTVRPIPVGGTGASSASGARTSLGLEIGADVQAFADALTALSSATPDADKLPYFTSTSASDVTDLSAFARTLLDDADAATARGTLSAMKGNQTTVTDWDTAIKDGHYYGDSSATNAPTAHAYVASIIRNDDNNLIQVAIRAGTGEVYIRARASGTFGSWIPLASEAYAESVSKLTQKTRQTASGTSIDFAGIPSGAKEVVIMFDGVMTNGTTDLLVQIGGSGGLETTGYASSSSDPGSNSASTAGFVIRHTTTGDSHSGMMRMSLMDAASFQWVQTHGMTRNSAAAISGGGAKSLSEELTQIRVTTVGGNTFNAGTVNIAYR